MNAGAGSFQSEVAQLHEIAARLKAGEVAVDDVARLVATAHEHAAAAKAILRRTESEVSGESHT